MLEYFLVFDMFQGLQQLRE